MPKPRKKAKAPAAAPAAAPPPPRRALVPVVLEPLDEAAIINNVLARDQQDPQVGDIEPDPTLVVLDTLVQGIVRGTNLASIKSEVQRLMSNAQEKAEIISAVLSVREFYRLNMHVAVHAHNESYLWRAGMRSDLTTTESLAFYRLSGVEIDKIRADMSRNAKQGAQVDDKAVDRVSGDAARDDKAIAETWKNTTPHGREIIRKRLYALKKHIAEAIATAPIGEEAENGGNPATT